MKITLIHNVRYMSLSLFNSLEIKIKTKKLMNVLSHPFLLILSTYSSFDLIFT